MRDKRTPKDVCGEARITVVPGKLKTMLANVFAIFFFGGAGGGGKQGALWDNAHMANRVKSTLF